MTFVGPSIGPVISGFLELKEDWRWTYYVMLWFGGATMVLMFTLPETYPPMVLINKAKRLRATGVPEYQMLLAPAEANGRKLASIFKVALSRPWVILFDTIALLCAVYMSVIYTLLYMLFSVSSSITCSSSTLTC